MGAVITFLDLPDPLPESDHTDDADHTNDDATGDDANATDDENVTGFPPVDDLTDGARGWRAGFAAGDLRGRARGLIHPHLSPWTPLHISSSHIRPTPQANSYVFLLCQIVIFDGRARS